MTGNSFKISMGLKSVVRKLSIPRKPSFSTFTLNHQDNLSHFDDKLSNIVIFSEKSI
jgi:hypothetical protein